MNSDFIKSQIIKYGNLLGYRQFSPATSGNISVKSGDVIYVTAAKTCLWNLTPEDVVCLSTDGNSLCLDAKPPSSEALLHLELYKKRPDIGAIIHCHPPKTSAFAVCGMDLEAPILTESVLYFDKIPVAKYALPSSKELAENTVKQFDKYDVVLMANHGLIAAAKTLEEAFYKVENAESYAAIHLNSLILGKPQELSKKQVEAILKLKK